jgi:hypothetical protein
MRRAAGERMKNAIRHRSRVYLLCAIMIALAACACAALLHPGPVVRDVVVSATLALLAVAMLNALYGAANRRPFWLGFTLCALVYYASATNTWLESHFGDRLLTRRVNALLFAVVHPQYSFSPWAEPDTIDPFADEPLPNPHLFETRLYDEVKVRSFVRECDCLWTVLLGCCGGLLAVRLRRANAKPAATPDAQEC